MVDSFTSIVHIQKTKEYNITFSQAERVFLELKRPALIFGPGNLRFENKDSQYYFWHGFLRGENESVVIFKGDQRENQAVGPLFFHVENGPEKKLLREDPGYDRFVSVINVLLRPA
ncbi:MAG: hypothetical protein KGH71_05665 [Candidatus Micrarchaeota archaeon]|nr:hypothetical protein [Candidatus Micrarchaeota archaeon]